MTTALLDTLKELELALQAPDSRSSTARLERLLHDDYSEFGRSGRVYFKPDQLEKLPVETPAIIHSQNFELKQLSANAALLTYQSWQNAEAGGDERCTLRSSVWVKTQDGWQMLFHQGTPTSPFSKLRD